MEIKYNKLLQTKIVIEYKRKEVLKIKLIYNIYIYYMFLAVFILPLNFVQTIKFSALLSGLTVANFIMVFFKDLFNHKKIKAYIFLFLSQGGIILAIFFLKAFDKSQVFIRELIYILIIWILFYRIDINKYIKEYKKKINWLFYISIIALSLQLIFYTNINRHVFSVLDSNGSGQIALLFFFLSNKLKKRIGIIFSMICSILFLSKNYILALIVFYFIRYIKKYFFRFIKNINYLYIILNILLIIISYIYITRNDFNNTINYDYGPSRIFKFKDQSNLYRFLFNIEVLNNLLDKDIFFIGNKKLYTQNIVEVSPHSDLFYMIYNFGVVYSIGYIIFILKTIKKNINLFLNIEYIFSYLFFGLFLSAIKAGPLLILFMIILRIENNSNKLVKIDDKIGVHRDDKSIDFNARI